ncbi:MAG: response regulator [Pirellulales bacterium]|nr:response regulator [Pirellulales bacterium]
MHVLIVDDSRAMRSILSHILRQLGLEVSEAANGREALDRLQELDQVQLALVDWNMPHMNGLEFVRQVRADSRFDDLRLMMVTTETEASQLVTALEAGANEYVMKPFTKDVVQEKLKLMGLLCDVTVSNA